MQFNVRILPALPLRPRLHASLPGAGPSHRREAEARERYVAPPYNTLIEAGKDICYSLVDRWDVILCGVPAEYEAFLAEEA